MKSGAVLKRPIPRERWELNNDDVELIEKIGAVSAINSFYVLMIFASSKLFVFLYFSLC